MLCLSSLQQIDFKWKCGHSVYVEILPGIFRVYILLEVRIYHLVDIVWLFWPAFTKCSKTDICTITYVIVILWNIATIEKLRIVIIWNVARNWKKLRIIILQNLAEIGNTQNCHSLQCCRYKPMSVIVVAEELLLNDFANITRAVQKNWKVQSTVKKYLCWGACS